MYRKSLKKYGGGSRIRTHGALACPTVFKTAAFGRSAIPPRMIILNIFGANVNRYQCTRLEPQVSPPPKAVRRTSESFLMEPSRTASSRAMGTVAEEMLPYFSIVM